MLCFGVETQELSSYRSCAYRDRTQELWLGGGNGSDADRIVPFPHPFPYFLNEYENSDVVEYEYGSDVNRIRIRIGCFLNSDRKRI